MMRCFLPIPISEFELVPYTYHLCEEESNFKQSLDKILDFLYEFKSAAVAALHSGINCHDVSFIF